MNERSEGEKLVDRIVYLSSLASEPRSVDPILDRLRIITATSTHLSPEGVKALEVVEDDLEEHLITKERLRSFTKESLRAHVEQHFASATPVRDTRRAALTHIITTITIASTITGILAILKIIQGQVVLAFFVFTLFAGLALLFRSIKKDLVSQLHESVSYLMAATVGVGLFALHFPIIAASSYLEHLPLLQHGGFLIGAIPVYAFYYVAFYLYAKQLEAPIPQALRPTGVVVTAIIIAIISVVIPHPVAVEQEIFYDIAVIGFAVSVYLSCVAAVLGFKAVPRTIKIYGKSTQLLAISLVLQTIGNANFLLFVTYPSGTFPVNEEKGQILTALIIMVALVFQYAAVYRSKTSLR